MDNSEYKTQLEQKWKDLLFIHKGRVNGFDLFFLNFALKGCQKILEYESSIAILNWALLAISLFLTYISISATTKRFRDIGISGWFALPYLLIAIVFITMVFNADQFVNQDLFLYSGLAGMLILGFTLVLWPAQKHDNKYGPYDKAGLFRSPLAIDKSNNS